MILAVILAAGAGRRIGGPKALLRIGHQSFLAHAASLFRRPGIDAVVAVVGHQAERVLVEAGLPPEVRAMVNPDPDAGMLGSVHLGLDAAEARGAGAVLIHPVDHPLVAPATIDRVVEALLGGAMIAVPSHQDRRGHPAGFARQTWPALRAAPAEQGAKVVLRQHPEWIRHVLGDAGCRQGIDTADDYRRLLGERPPK